jgi:MutL protein
VLSHAPRRNQTMHMLIDAFLPEGFTFLGVDSIFMMPHLGVLAQVNPLAAQQVFDRDCMIYLGSCIAPRGTAKYGDPVMDYDIDFGGGRRETGTLKSGELKLIGDFPVGADATAEVRPQKRFDCGEGPGKPVKDKVRGGVVGLVLDGRCRPLQLNSDAGARAKQLIEWGEALCSYVGVNEKLGR